MDDRRTYVEIVVSHWTHGTPHPSHLQLGLIVHIPDELSAEARVLLELVLLHAGEIRSLL